MQEMESIQQTLIMASILVPVLTAVVELIKKTISLPKNTIPLISVIVGVILGIVSYPFTDLDLILRVWGGVFAGLAATGLFEIVPTDFFKKTYKDLKAK